jgi:hypothetical protein
MKRRRVLNAGAPVGCERLRRVTFGYVGFDGQPHRDGEIVVLDVLAEEVAQIFTALHGLGFPIAKARGMEHYDGDDDAAIADNNTSSFNHRTVAGSSALSLHAYGVAIDLNPVQNPFIRRSGASRSVEPAAGAPYVNRKDRRPGMAESVVTVFATHGFAEWGGRWGNPIDYQHFQVNRGVATQLVRLPAAQAKAVFAHHLDRIRACLRAGGGTVTRACALTP